MIEAAEEFFVPLAIYNNTEDDADAKIRELYHEPAWNYQVVRVVDAKGKDLIPRVEKDWTVAAVAEAMLAGLKASKREQPTWLQLLAEEQRAFARGVESAIFGMS